MEARAESKRGVIYIATGEAYRSEAIISAESVKRHSSKVPIALFTDKPPDSSLFDIIRLIENPTFSVRDKARFIAESPFEESLYLDSDTFCLGSIDEIFELLNRFDIALAHAPVRDTFAFRPDTVPPSLSIYSELPACFPEFNAGIIAFRNLDAVREVLLDWHTQFEADFNIKGSSQSDQPILRALLYSGRLRIATLPPEYNFRVPAPGYAGGPVKIIHGHAPSLGLTTDSRTAFAKLGAALNATPSLPRVYVRRLGVLVRNGSETIPVGGGMEGT